MQRFYSLVPRSVTAGVRPFSAGHVAFLFTCLPGLSLLVSALFRWACLFICLPGLSLLVSALFRWLCSISIHLSPRSVTAGVRPFPLAMFPFVSVLVSLFVGHCVRLAFAAGLSPKLVSLHDSLLAAAAVLFLKLVSLHDFALGCRCHLVSQTFSFMISLLAAAAGLSPQACLPS